MMHIAAELIGRVNVQPTSTDTVIPIMNGLSLVASFTIEPRYSMKSLIGEQQYFAINPPVMIVTRGVRIISTGVFFETNAPTLEANTTETYAPTGPPN